MREETTDDRVNIDRSAARKNLRSGLTPNKKFEAPSSQVGLVIGGVIALILIVLVVVVSPTNTQV